MLRISPGYPQSNGKIERWHQTVKNGAIRPQTPLSLKDARKVVGQFVSYYNNERLHSAIGYITPFDKLMGKADAIFAERRQKMQQARDIRAQYWSEESLNVKELM